MYFSSILAGLSKKIIPGLCAVLFACTQVLCAQPRTYTIKDGLPNRKVWQTLEDHQGFLWVGTSNGLARFDGHAFTLLENVGEDSVNLVNPDITALAETPQGRLCIGTLRGLAILSADRSQLHYPIPENNPLARQHIISIAAFDEDHIAFSSRFNVHILSKKEGLKTIALTGKTEAPLTIRLQAIDKDRVLIIYTERKSEGKNFMIIDRSGNILDNNKVNHPYLDGVLGPNNQVYFIGVENSNTPENTIWVNAYSLTGEATGQWQFRPSFHINKRGDHPYIFYALGYFWINQMGSPIIRFDPSRGDFSLSAGEEISRKKPALAGNFFNIYGDSYHNLWLSTNGGLIGLSLKKNRFKALRPAQVPEDEVFGTRLLYPWDAQHLFVSSVGNSFLMNVENQEFTPYDPKKPNGSPANIRCMMPFEDRELLVGTEWSSLYWLKRGSTVLEPASLKSEPLIRSAMDMATDKNGRIWAVGINGLFWIDLDAGVKHRIEGLEFEDIQIVYGLSYDPERHVIWAVGDIGLIKYEIGSGRHKIYDLQLPDHAMATGRSLSLVRKKEVLWIGTWESGLVKFDMATEKATHFTTQNGLCHNLVYSILEDAGGRLWLGTANGLSAFDPETEKFVNFYEKDGIAHNEFNTGSVYQAPDGKLYMGGVNGLTVFDPEEVLAVKENPRLRLSRIIRHDGLSNREVTTTYAIAKLEKLVIYPEDRYFTVFFSPENPLLPSKRFEYKIKGLEDSWNFLDDRQEIRFAALPSGNYELMIRLAGKREGQSDVLALPIKVLAPWYQRWWAISVFTIAGLALLFLFYMLRMKQLQTANRLKLEQLRMEKKEELDQLKSDFFANISHEFRTPLTLILGPIEEGLASENKSTGEKSLLVMRRNANRLLSLINQLLDLSKLDSGKMKFRPVVKNLAAHLRLLCSNFESPAAKREVEMQLAIDKQELLACYDVDQMEKIINNLLSNALKFCDRGGCVEVMCRKAGDETVRISVTNTGQDISAHILPNLFKRFYQQEQDMGQGTGIGLALTKELVELHNGTITASSAKGLTTFIVELPLNLDEEVPVGPETKTFYPSVLPATSDTEAEAKLPKAPAAKEDAPLVLVVDDNADLREFLTGILQANYQVLQAENGREGWEQARERIPDLVVSDLMMPEMNGNRLCHKLKTDALTSHIPVILLTAKATQESKLEGLEKGADDYLMKPFSGSELLARAKNLIKLRRLLQEKYSGQKLVEMGARPPLNLEDEFLQKVIRVLEAHLHEESFTVHVFYDELFLSPRQVQRKLKALTGQTPTNFIRRYRLQKAYEKIRNKEGTISEIAISVGMADISHFSHSFKKEFGIAPSEL